MNREEISGKMPKFFKKKQMKILKQKNTVYERFL